MSEIDIQALAQCAANPILWSEIKNREPRHPLVERVDKLYRDRFLEWRFAIVEELTPTEKGWKVLREYANGSDRERTDP